MGGQGTARMPVMMKFLSETPNSIASIPERRKLISVSGSESSVELIITGTVTREDKPPLRVSSIAMQAKLCGLHFTLEDGVLGTLSARERNLGYAT